MSQNQVSLNGGREKIVTNSSPVVGRFLSNQYVEVRNLTPKPTEWAPGGRPIYDRLPSASERYKLNFSYDEDSAYTYIPIGEGRTGSTSMFVQTSGEDKYLVIQGGNIVWKYGTIKTNPVLIDLELVEMGSARYLLAYQLYYDDAPILAQYEVSGMPLSGFTMDVNSNTDSVLGWRYSTRFAFLGENERFWSNYDGLFPTYSQDAYLSWQLPQDCAFSQITLRCPPNTTHTGTATLYYLSCSEIVDGVCQNPVWNFAETVNVSKDDSGQYYDFSVDAPWICKGWKVEWSDPTVSINNIFVSGMVTQLRKPATMYTSYGLVAYPLNAIPSKFTNSLGEDVPLILCKLAYVDINSAYTVEKVQDIREIVYTSYEPVTDWLTRTWDDNLIRLFEQFSNYSVTWMSPPLCMKQEYESLKEDDIFVSFDECPSPNYQQT